MEKDSLHLQPDDLDFIQSMLSPNWAELYISNLLDLDVDKYEDRLRSEATLMAMNKLNLSAEDINGRYWRKTWLPRLMDLFKSEVEEGNKDARIFVGKIVNSPKPVTPPDWLVKAWYNHDAGIVTDKPRRGDAKLFEERVRNATLHALIQRYRTKGFEVRKGPSQALVEEYLSSTSKVAKDKAFIEAITGRVKDWPDTVIVMLAGLANINLKEFAEFLGLKDNY
jgi:hypothetical protein